MLFTILLLTCLAAMTISLFAGLFFLFKDKGGKKRLMYALFARVVLAATVIILVSYAVLTKRITPHSPMGLVPHSAQQPKSMTTP